MIEIFRKGVRLDIPETQIITFKKSQNLNGIQNQYAYSNTVSVKKTANIIKILELNPLPTGKVSSLQNGYTVDVVINRTIQLRNQTLKITKESKESIDLYLLYSDNALIVKLKEVFLKELVKEFTYKKTEADFVFNKFHSIAPSAFVETQPKSGFFVLNEMPLLLNLQFIIRRIFESNGYSVYGDFFQTDNTIKDYFITENKGIYRVFSGTPFAPTFDDSITAFDLLNQTLAFFNCYAETDDTAKTVIINLWSNLGAYKNSFIDYSKYFVDYQDYEFQSRLAKKNELTYSDSGTTFNSFFTNLLSSQDKATYLSSAFGSGSTNVFDDAKLEAGLLETRQNNEEGEVSAIRIFKKSADEFTFVAYENGIPKTLTGQKAISVSMFTVFNEFHRTYSDFIISPLITNIEFRYDAVFAADFSLTKVFFIEQLASYWIPLEINFSSAKDKILVRAMLIKQRKVVAPILNNLNSILLDFKERALVPLDLLLSLFPMPPNLHPWQDIIFKGYNQDFNRIYINGNLITPASMPQVFSIASILTFEIESNKITDSQPDRNSDSLFIQAIDTNGGISNDAYINIQHTGIASLESNFIQLSEYNYFMQQTDFNSFFLNVLSYATGNKPNLNLTRTSVAPKDTININDNDTILIQTNEFYSNVRVRIEPFNLYVATIENGTAKASAVGKLILMIGNVQQTLFEFSISRAGTRNFLTHVRDLNVPAISENTPIRLFFQFTFKNNRGLNSGSVTASVVLSNFNATISTTKTV